MADDLLSAAAEDVTTLQSLGPPPDVAVVLGSGLSHMVDALEAPVTVEYSSLVGFPHPRGVPGHPGRLALGSLAGHRVAVFAGRLHVYEGLTALQAAYPARLASAIGARMLVVTNAAGAVSDRVTGGGCALIRDHVNMLGDTPLRGWTGGERGDPFVSMADAYSPRLRRTASEAAEELGVELREGVYAAVLGPAYETPAEVEALRILGVDMVGMSTVPEVLAARALGVEVLGLSLVTNLAGETGLSHEEVLRAGQRGAMDLERLLAGILSRL